MHNIHKVTYPENVNKKSVQQEWDNDAACAGKEEGASGLDKDIDIVNIGLHFFHKDVRLYAASCSEV